MRVRVKKAFGYLFKDAILDTGALYADQLLRLGMVERIDDEPEQDKPQAKPQAKRGRPRKQRDES
jgi:hypothetical protein